MKSRNADNWSFKLSQGSAGANGEAFVMFSCPFIGTNILYTFEQISSVLYNKVQSVIPAAVMQEALDTFQSAVHDEAMRA